MTEPMTEPERAIEPEAERESGSFTSDDPHASRIDPNDPRLSIPRHELRVLKTKPVAVGIVGLVALAALAIMVHVRKPAAKVAITEEPAKLSDKPIIPAFIEEAPSTPLPPVERPAPAAPVPLFPPLAPALPPRPPPVDPVAERAREKQAELDEQARGAGLFFQTTSREATERAASAPPSASSAPPLPLGMAALPPGPGGVLSPGAAPAAFDPNQQDRKNAFLDAPHLPPDYLPTTIQAPLSPYELKATSIIPATLLTGINSDLPGPIIAQVRERVFDTATGRYLLIPQGARLLASYDSMVAWGQERVLLCWNRLVFPDGHSINLRCMPAADLTGQAGLADEVDQHWGRLLAAAGLSTILSLGVQASAGNPSGFQPSLAQSAARNAAGEVSVIGQSIVQRQINIQPTITVRPGFGVNVIVNTDMILEPYAE
jgi:type IV secretory pathway VirB10-like protein